MCSSLKGNLLLGDLYSETLSRNSLKGNLLLGAPKGECLIRSSLKGKSLIESSLKENLLLGAPKREISYCKIPKGNFLFVTSGRKILYWELLLEAAYRETLILWELPEGKYDIGNSLKGNLVLGAL